MRTERLGGLIAPPAGLHVDLELPRQQPERAFLRRRNGAERRARETLAVGAVADRNRVRIDFGFVSDKAAMASAVDLQRPSYVLIEPPSTAMVCPVMKSLSLEARNTSAPSRSFG